MSAAASATRASLSGRIRRALGCKQAQSSGALDREPQRELQQRHCRRAITPPMPNWRWTRTAISSRCACERIANIGAYVSTFGAAIPSAIYSALLAGVYTTPAITVECTGVFTNTVPTDAYRGAGRPEACYVLERLADRAAEALGTRPRRNPAPQSHSGRGDALPDSDRADLRLRRFPACVCARAAGGRCRWLCRPPQGFAKARSFARLGFACFVESSGVAPSGLPASWARASAFTNPRAISMEPDGSVRARFGTHNHGQGHETSFAQILSSQLGVPMEKIEISRATPISCHTAPALLARAASQSAALR